MTFSLPMKVLLYSNITGNNTKYSVSDHFNCFKEKVEGITVLFKNLYLNLMIKNYKSNVSFLCKTVLKYNGNILRCCLVKAS